jgi:anti-sigma B factor antagonist
VVAFAAEIDAANARWAGRQLRSAFSVSASGVVADLTLSTFCDSSGTRELAPVHQKAAARGIELRVVVPSASVRQIFELPALRGPDTMSRS